MADSARPGADGPVWLNEPSRWSLGGGADGGDLSMSADGGTDFWRHTHYGFVRDSGHAWLTRVTGDFEAVVDVQADDADQYDQAGLLVRMDRERWLKCGFERVDGAHRLSAVVTHAVSDWSCAPVRLGEWLGVRVTRVGDAVTVDFALTTGDWRMHRMAYLPPDLPVSVGPMAAAPDGAGFDVRFRGLRIGRI